jgi:hypothetical protein
LKHIPGPLAAVAKLLSGVGLDVVGKGFDHFPVELRNEIVARYPRKRFKKQFVDEYFRGFAHKPETTYGTVNAGVCERFMAGAEATCSRSVPMPHTTWRPSWRKRSLNPCLFSDCNSPADKFSSAKEPRALPEACCSVATDIVTSSSVCVPVARVLFAS